MSTLAAFTQKPCFEHLQNSIEYIIALSCVPYLRMKAVQTNANCLDLKNEIDAEACPGHDVYQTNIFIMQSMYVSAAI